MRTCLTKDERSISEFCLIWKVNITNYIEIRRVILSSIYEKPIRFDGELNLRVEGPMCDSQFQSNNFKVFLYSLDSPLLP